METHFVPMKLIEKRFTITTSYKCSAISRLSQRLDLTESRIATMARQLDFLSKDYNAFRPFLSYLKEYVDDRLSEDEAKRRWR